MATKKRSVRTVGTVRPIGVGGLAKSMDTSTGDHEPSLLLPPRHVLLWSSPPVVDVVAMLGPDGARVVHNYARYDRVDRPGKRSITHYDGLDPYEMSVDLVFDGLARGDSVEPTIRVLEQLAEPAAGQKTPRAVKIAGPVPHPGLNWHLDGSMDEDTDWVIRLNGERVRTRLRVTLLQHVVDDQLIESINRSRRKGAGKGSGVNTTKVRTGEDSYSDVAKRVYRTRDRAAELARANNDPVGKRLHRGDKVRY